MSELKTIDYGERVNIKELFKNYEGEYRQEEVDWGSHVGNEIL